jgi:hypothetical protein
LNVFEDGIGSFCGWRRRRVDWIWCSFSWRHRRGNKMSWNWKLGEERGSGKLDLNACIRFHSGVPMLRMMRVLSFGSSGSNIESERAYSEGDNCWDSFTTASVIDGGVEGELASGAETAG